QISLPEKYMAPLKAILKFHKAVREAAVFKRNLNYSETYDGFTVQDTEEIYTLLARKLSLPLFKGIGILYRLSDELIDALPKFRALSVEDRVYVINEVLHTVQSNNLSADLQLIGKAKRSATTTINMKQSSADMTLLYPSVTGLYLNKLKVDS
ncbi:MAG: Cas9 endonuclease PAM-interacting domain-containing protein, partial [Christensenellales bacterium]